MAYTTINKSTDYFNTKLYTGTGAELAVSSVGFQPDWVWLKDKGAVASHILTDAVRGATKVLKSNTTGAESTNAQALKSFDSDGFTLGTTGDINTNTNSYISWNWKAGNSSGSSNTDGSITSTVSANTTSGFSIVKWTGSGANATIGHGLGSAPKLIITKSLAATQEWCVGSDAIGWGNYLFLNETSAVQSGSTYWQSTAPTSSVFSVGTAGPTNSSSGDLIAYCFAEKKGFSKFGSYTGNNNADGIFVYTGFKPAFLMIKNRNVSPEYWYMFDNRRLGYNPDNNQLVANGTGGDDTADRLDILSNGFKARQANPSVNDGNGFFYIAFAEAPLVGSNNVPCTAR